MKKTFRQQILAITFTAAILATGNAPAGEIVVITHPSAGITQLTKEEVLRIFLIKTKTYQNEKPVVPVIPLEQAETRKRFESVVFEKSPMQIKAYWTRLLFTGRGSPPKALASDEDIRKKVAENPNAIGYIDISALDDSVMAVFTVK